MKITQQDIADALSLSRNTVSKALKNDILVSPKTIKRVQEYARKMQYEHIQEEIKTPHLNNSKNIIMLLAHSTTANDNSFWMQVISGIQTVVSSKNYHLSINFVDSVDSISRDSQIAGYIVIGMFDEKEYYKIIQFEENIPVVFIDVATKIPLNALQKDIVLMENVESVRELTQHLIDSGHTSIGFVGNVNARSIYDRYRGFKKAMKNNNIRINPTYCLTNLNSDYRGTGENSLKQWLYSLTDFPTAVVCANDSIAILMIETLTHELNKSVPDDISICGFDNLYEGKMISPCLTTVHCFKTEIGRRAAEEILWRIENLDRPYEIIRVGTQVIYRDSTAQLM